MADEDEKLSLMAQLIQLAKADEEVREAEHQFLLSIAVMLEIDPEAFGKLFDEFIDFEPPALEMERIVQLQRLVLLMNVDLEIDGDELATIRDLGMRMGLHASAVNSVLEEMHNYENKMIPPDRLIAIFTTFHN